MVQIVCYYFCSIDVWYKTAFSFIEWKVNYIGSLVLSYSYMGQLFLLIPFYFLT